MAGYDTAGTIQATGAGALSEFGENPQFWVRYFSPSPAADVINSSASGANAECEGLWKYNNDSPCLGVVAAPTQSRLSGSSAEGVADAQTYGAAITFVFDNVTPLDNPANGELFCWLDQEASTSLSDGYWSGFASTLNGSDTGAYHHYTGLYCDPDAAPPNCSVIDAYVGTSSRCYAVWSSEPEYTSNCSGGIKSAPAWAAESCASVTTYLWQYVEQGVCGYSANVDLNEGRTGTTYGSYCFKLSANP
jgi:hypothetical protein